MAEFCINSLLPPVHVAHCSVLHSSTISVVKYEDYRHRNPNSNDKLVRPQTILGAVVSRKKISDICHQNASDAKYAFGAGDGNCLDILLYPRGRRQALHPLKDVPQGVNQIFLNKLYFSLEKKKLMTKSFFPGHHRSDCVGHWGRLWHWKAHVSQVRIAIILNPESRILNDHHLES